MSAISDLPPFAGSLPTVHFSSLHVLSREFVPSYIALLDVFP